MVATTILAALLSMHNERGTDVGLQVEIDNIGSSSGLFPFVDLGKYCIDQP